MSKLYELCPTECPQQASPAPTDATLTPTTTRNAIAAQKQHRQKEMEDLVGTAAQLQQAGIERMCCVHSDVARSSGKFHQPLVEFPTVNALRFARLRPVVQQGGSKALIPIALSSTEKGERAAAQALARIGITQDPSIAFPGNRSCDVVRPIAKLLKEEIKSIENFEALMALACLALGQ